MTADITIRKLSEAFLTPSMRSGAQQRVNARWGVYRGTDLIGKIENGCLYNRRGHIIGIKITTAAAKAYARANPAMFAVEARA